MPPTLRNPSSCNNATIDPEPLLMMINNELDLDLQKIIHDRLKVSLTEIEDYCQRWQITEFALFGSVLRDDFRPDSDIDVLITFAPNHHSSFSDWLDMREEIEQRLGRKVDLIQKKLLKNPYSRAEILRTHQVIYASQ